MRFEVTLPPRTPSIRHPSFGSRSSSWAEDSSTILPLRDQSRRRVGRDAAALSGTLPMEQRRPNKHLPAPLSLPTPRNHTWLQNQLHIFFFSIKSESPTEGMTWLLQLIFFPPFKSSGSISFGGSGTLQGGGAVSQRRAAFECLVLIGDRDQHGKSSLSPQYGRQSVRPGPAYQTACRPLS